MAKDSVRFLKESISVAPFSSIIGLPTGLTFSGCTYTMSTPWCIYQQL